MNENIKTNRAEAAIFNFIIFGGFGICNDSRLGMKGKNSLAMKISASLLVKFPQTIFQTFSKRTASVMFLFKWQASQDLREPGRKIRIVINKFGRALEIKPNNMCPRIL